MGRRKKYIVPEIATKFVREFSLVADGFEIKTGDIIKVKGEYGVKFKFYSLTTNIETGSQWVDCFETHRQQSGVFRSFYPERVKRVPQRGKRAKRVN